MKLTPWWHADSFLHVLGPGLCFEVYRGDLTVDQATGIFENMRSTLIDAKERNMEMELEDDKNPKKDYNINSNFKDET